MPLVARSFLDLRGVQQRRDDRGRADADRNARLHELCTALLARLVEIVTVVAHHRLLHTCALSMARGGGLEAA